MGYIIAFVVLFLIWKVISSIFKATGKAAGWITRPIISELYKGAIHGMMQKTGADFDRATMYVHLILLGAIVAAVFIIFI